MARPRLAPDDKLSESVRISFRPSDYAAIADSADRARTNVTDFVRAAALGQKMTVIQSQAPDFDTRNELRRIGVNLNQIAKSMNARQQALPASLVACCEQLETLLERWLIHDPTHHDWPQL